METQGEILSQIICTNRNLLLPSSLTEPMNSGINVIGTKIAVNGWARLVILISFRRLFLF
jgi:hypothetical protein